MSDVVPEMVTTLSGLTIDLDSPGDYPFSIEEVAHALAMQCRYNGHVARFYSVAEHACHVSDWFLGRGDRLLAMVGLHHDDPEFALGDLVRPVKRRLLEYQWVEDRVAGAMARWLGLPTLHTMALAEIDYRVTIDERLALQPRFARDPSRHPDPLGVTIHGWSPTVAREEYIRRHHELS